ncbi:hypothetical protein [Clostridium estertheticum]|uniref:hypothetical protein n=1 Tax=Clostridium estertheticum TaxID=238834 RepID=UPI001C0B7E5B|nr:hypothetical protein [Clostridium estertheticum]MBU3173407.1 hypothetical protein [Clostridium estertheticum]
MSSLKPNNGYTKEDILEKAKRGAYMNTDGLKHDLNGEGIAIFLESIGFNVISYEDLGPNGIVKTKEGIKVSTNGNCSMI